MKGKVLICSNKMKNLKKRIRELAQTKIQTGHFQESGQHPEADMSYVELAFLLKDTPPSRDLRLGVSQWMYTQEFKSLYRKKVKDYIHHSKPMNKSLDFIGSELSEYAKGLFGAPNSFNPSNADWWADYKGSDSPMLFEGHLRDSWAYKVLPDGSIKYRR